MEGEGKWRRERRTGDGEGLRQEGSRREEEEELQDGHYNCSKANADTKYNDMVLISRVFIELYVRCLYMYIVHVHGYQTTAADHRIRFCA